MSDNENEKTGIIYNGLPPVAYQGAPESFQPMQFPQHGHATQYPQDMHLPAYQQQNVYATQQPIQQNQAWGTEQSYPKPLADSDDSYYRCLCKTHVHKGVIAVCIISIISSVIELIFDIVFTVTGSLQIVVTIWPAIISILIHVLLLFGNRKKIKWMYWPYLIIHLLSIALLLFVAIICIILIASVGELSGGSAPLTDDNGNSISSEAIVGTQVLLGIVSALYLIVCIVQIYFFWIVIRSFQYLKNVLLNPNSTLPRI
ncbi:hypothetical protein M3Y97_00189600 [Aphelenchoides bicaudatus]|nr:hypothetical protein M3Y97_00189600 [Aphelenchoides bicaudatus]